MIERDLNSKLLHSLKLNHLIVLKSTRKWKIYTNQELIRLEKTSHLKEARLFKINDSIERQYEYRTYLICRNFKHGKIKSFLKLKREDKDLKCERSVEVYLKTQTITKKMEQNRISLIRVRVQIKI